MIFSEFFELLLKNDNLELSKWLISHGKSQKVSAAVMFIKKDEDTDKKNEEDN